MATITRRSGVILAATTILTGCGTTTATSTGDMSPDDLEFVTGAFNIIEFDRQECSLAQTQARLPEVKTLAAQLLQEANDFDARLRPLVAAAGIKPPSVLRPDLRIRVAHLRLNQGLDFDSTFVEDQIASHQDALNIQENLIATPNSNPRLQALSREAHTTMRANLTKLRALQRKILMMPS
jgi:predicted outer membrane protein